MKKIMYLLTSLFISVFVTCISVFGDDRTKNDTTKSEFHARDRYAVAEKIEQELKEKLRPVISNV